MKNAIEKVIKQPFSSDRDSLGNRSLKFVLALLSAVYRSVVCSRLLLYRFGFLKGKRLPCFVLSIGNLAAGGTGKTPMTIHSAKMLLAAGYKVVIISRGYKRQFGKAVRVVSDGENIHCSVRESGDEAYMMASSVNCPVIVGKSRYHSGRLAIEKFNPDVILLDDAFQHLALEQDLKLLLLDSRHPFGNGALLPRGPLREPVESIGRSDAVVMTRGFGEEGASVHPRVKEIGVPVFQTFHVTGISRVVVNGADTGQSEKSASSRKKIFLFSAVANNDLFIHSCRELGFHICGNLEFSDHFWYTDRDLERVLRRSRETGAECIGTTEKDYVKIQKWIADLPELIVFDIEIGFSKEDGDAFKRFIHNRLTSYQAKAYGSER